MATPDKKRHTEASLVGQHQALFTFLQQPTHLLLLSRLAGMLSHDIRNPLTTMFLHVDILEDALPRLVGEPAAQLTHTVAVLRGEAQRLEALVQSFLWLLRLPDLPRYPENLGSYLAAFVHEVQPWLAARQLQLICQDTAHLGSIALHKPTFQRLLLALLANAGDAMPEGGVMRLRGQRLEQHIRLELCDTGCGLTPAQMSLLFQPFSTTKKASLGLGLYMARAIVLAHAGDITIESTPGVGTTVQLTFPVCPHDPSS